MIKNSLVQVIGLCWCLWGGFSPGCSAAADLCQQNQHQASPDSTEPLLAFESEHIRLVVVGDSLQVDGLYRFVCGHSEAKSTILFYPFPCDSLLGGARMVSLAGRPFGGEWQPLRFKDYYPQAWGASWQIPLSPRDRYEVRAVYTQALKTEYGRYIVTTTGNWRDPLKTARFEISLPAGAVPASFSFPFERHESDGEVLYVFEVNNFRPDRDVIFTWTR